MLQCPVCSRNGFQRLTRHLSQAHGIKKAEARERWPGVSLAVEKPEREIPCSDCGEPVKVKGGAGHAKCGACRQTDDRDKVACRVCGAERRRLRAHLKSDHGLTLAAYRAQFPEALTEVPGIRKRSAECRAKQAAAARQRWADPEERKAQSERLKVAAPWKGKTLSEEHKKAISEGGKGVKHNISPEGRLAKSRAGRISNQKLRQLPDYSERLSRGVKRRIARGEKVGFMRPALRAKSFETRIKNGPPPNAGRGICGFRKGLSHYTRSTTEANFARVLVDAGVDYQYEPRCFRIEIEGKTHHYTPDFFLEKPLMLGERVLVPAGWLELKGWRHKDGRLPAGSQEKLDALRALVDEPVNVLTGSDPEWAEIRRHWMARVQWETPSSNLRNNPLAFAGPKL